MKLQKPLSLLLCVWLLVSLLGTAALADASIMRTNTVTVNEDGSIDGYDGHVTLLVDGVETALRPGAYTGDVVVAVTDGFTVQGSASQEPGGGPPPGGGGSGESDGERHVGSLNKTILGNELRSARNSTDYRTALYVDENGVSGDYSVIDAVTGGSVTPEGAYGITVEAESDTFAGLVVESAPYTLAEASITLDTEAVGGTTNDFSGLGAAISAYGQGTLLTIEDSAIETTGVVKPALFISGGADVIVKNSSLTANGGTVYGTYLSNANQGTMIGAPWHLGIDNALGNSRCVNLMGAQSTETVVDSAITAAGWGGLSVDDGSYMRMDVINSTVDVDEGYGAFAIGQVTENWRGSDIHAGVLDFILMGGYVNIGAYTGGEEITVLRMEVKDSGEGIDAYYAQETDEVVTTVKSDALASGERKTSHIVSDRFGFEAHSMMLNDTVNAVTLAEGTEVETSEAAFIVKSGFAEITVDDASVSAGVSPYTGERVFLQMMDNDDGFCGLTNFQYSTFGEYFWEPDGWSFEFHDTIDTDDYDLQGGSGYDVCAYGTEAAKDLGQWWTRVELRNTDIAGDLWNSTGYWTQGGSDLYVTVGENASVTGVISAGAYQHYAKTYEVGLYGYYSATGEESVPLESNEWYNSPYSGSWENAKYISVVANTPYYYGANGVDVTLTDGGVWNVTAPSFLTGLTVDGGILANVGGIYKVLVDVTPGQNAADTVTVTGIGRVDWNGGDIAFAAEDEYTFFVIVPEGDSVDNILSAGDSLGYAAKKFEGHYFGSFYDPAAGLQAEPMPLPEQESAPAASGEAG